VWGQRGESDGGNPENVGMLYRENGKYLKLKGEEKSGPYNERQVEKKGGKLEVSAEEDP